MNYMNEIISTRGDTIYRQININKNGTAYTLQDGEKVYFTVKLDNTAVIKKEFGYADLIDGKIILKIEPSETDNLSLGTYAYDVEVHFLNGDVATIIKASDFKLTKEITTAADIEVV